MITQEQFNRFLQYVPDKTNHPAVYQAVRDLVAEVAERVSIKSYNRGYDDACCNIRDFADAERHL